MRQRDKRAVQGRRGPGSAGSRCGERDWRFNRPWSTEIVLRSREHGQVAPIPALESALAWGRYNVNYQFDDLGPPIRFHGLEMEVLPWHPFPPQTGHDLGLFVFQSRSGIRGRLVYNASRFSGERAARASAHLAALIAGRASS